MECNRRGNHEMAFLIDYGSDRERKRMNSPARIHRRFSIAPGPEPMRSFTEMTRECSVWRPGPEGSCSLLLLHPRDRRQREDEDKSCPD